MAIGAAFDPKQRFDTEVAPHCFVRTLPRELYEVARCGMQIAAMA
jgi:hypothetical protein